MVIISTTSSMAKTSGTCEYPSLFLFLYILQHAPRTTHLLPSPSLIIILQSRAGTSTYQHFHIHSYISSFASGALEYPGYRGSRVVHTWTNPLASKVT